MAASAETATRARLEKAAKLIDLLMEMRGKEHEIVEELRRLLDGGDGIGATLKRIQGYFDTTWCARYAPGQSGRYVWTFVKDVPQMKRLLKALTVEQIEQRIAGYLRDPDPFYVKARHPFGLFVSNVNRFAEAAPADLELSAPTVPGCKHVPPCGTDQEHTRRRSADMRGEVSPF